MLERELVSTPQEEAQDRFTRSRLLFGDHWTFLQSKRVLIFGVGGVGGFALDGLYRCGVTNLTIIDKDRFDITNQNRQIGAESIGEIKVKVLEKLYPGIVGIEARLDELWLESFIAQNPSSSSKQFCGYDYVIDAIDDIPAKILLAKACASMPYGRYICSTGSAKKFDPSHIKVASIWKSYGDRFARKLRDGLKKAGFKGDYKVIFSPEPPKCKGLGSFSAVTASFGLQIASEVARDIIKES
ncbi:ThiF family adenylyltransferase [Helicobacter canis]|uniref:Molybdopterin biosynthesis protein n=1 Tax=Helicobacter canis TaxID=29419 RepID=A0A377J4N5_9HELI|nr:ThiF family adenylyltransferase [Helicobacter canis]STO97318.1 molybdopterin biosynthesis protein [Helicobacter canis]